MVNFLLLYLEMYIEPHLGLVLEQNWAFSMDPLMVLMMARLRDYCLEVHWGILMAKFLALMKASN